jgi:Transposase
VRCRIQREQTGHRDRTGDPLYRICRLLHRAANHHTQRSWTRLLAGLAAGNTPDEQLTRTWIAAQGLRLIFHCPDRTRTEQALDPWLAYCADSRIPELIRPTTTIGSWRTELLAYFTTGGISNGPTEAINLLTKKVKRVGHGSATSTTTDSAYDCTVASTGTLSKPRRSEDGYQAQRRRATFPPSPYWTNYRIRLPLYQWRIYLGWPLVTPDRFANIQPLSGVCVRRLRGNGW